jgi:hypothetical protein
VRGAVVGTAVLDATVRRDEPGGDPYGLDQARRIGQAFPCDVESGPVCHAGAHDRQSQGHVDSALEADGLKRNVPLVVIHRYDGVKRPAQSLVKERIVRKRTRDVETLARCKLDGRADQSLLFVAKKTILTRMRVERRDRDPRRRSAGQGAHRPVGEADLGVDRLAAQ